MIKFENVIFGYGEEKKVLNNVSFQIEEGEQVGLIGANGAGKSTLMKTMLGLIVAKGKITVDGIEVNQENLGKIRQYLGYVLQDSDNQMFMPTVYEDMIFGPLNYGKSREEADQLVQSALEKLGLMHLKDRQNYKMSGGEKRMAAIATILAMNPKVMLMDEPSTALDPKNRRRLIQILQKLPATKIIATHDLDLVLETCDRVLVLNQGKLVADGSVQDILWNREFLEKYDLELPFCLAGIPERFR